MRAAVILILTVLATLGKIHAGIRDNRDDSRSLYRSQFATGTWIRITVNETGLYRLDRAALQSAGVEPSGFQNMASFRLFGNGGQPLPEDLTAPRPEGVTEIRRHLDDRDGDGIFDPEDGILFFGRGTTLWQYTPGAGYAHVVNPYSNDNVYFLTYGGAAGLAMDSVTSLNDPSPAVATRVGGMTFVEEETINLLHSGRSWVGQLLNSQVRSRTYQTPLPGVDPAFPVTYRIAVLGRTSRTESFVVREGSQVLGGPITIVPVSLTSLETNYAHVPAPVTYVQNVTLTGEQSNLQIEFQTLNGEGWVNWFEIFYRRRPEASNDMLMFPTPDTTANMEYRLTGFSSDQTGVFDISRHDSVVRITGIQRPQAGESRFQYPASAGSSRMILAAGPGAWKTPAGMNIMEPSDLRGSTDGAEFVIVCPAEFREEAERLGLHRRETDSLSFVVVPMESVTNEFGGGLTDPMAIRDFLAHARMAWTVPPAYVLLFGDGHYDYRNRATTQRNPVPPYESVESIHQINTYASDDLLVRLIAGDARISLPVGRLPVNTPDEARMIVDKIITYDRDAAQGPWRNRVTFVADDGLTSSGDDGSIHTLQANALAVNFTPAVIDKKKIFIVEYPTVNSSTGRRKPSANEAIIRAINEGTLILNYTGHGNPRVWAHEGVFSAENSIPQLTNADRPFLLVAATCDFARYDLPGEVSAGETLVTMRGGGAVAVVTASRAVYSNDNFQFNNTLFTEIFRKESDGRPSRIGDAFFRTKQIYYALNDLKYHLFADPTMRLHLPLNTGRIDSLNGNALLAPVQVRALEKPLIAGGILKADSTAWTAFDGTALLEVFDAPRTVMVPEWNNYQFEVQGSLLYRGEVSVQGGRLQAVIPVPKDISHEGSAGRIAFTAWGALGSVAGFTDRIIVAGSDSTAVTDTTGPLITIYLEDESFRSGDMVNPDPELIVRLFDENGINTSTAGIGHRLQASLSSTSGTVNLHDHYRGDLDTYQAGEIRYTLKDLQVGRQQVTVTAWDTHNNVSTEQAWFEVRMASDPDLYNVFNVPNPFSRSTTFTFQRSSTQPVDVEVRIYTVAGRLIAHMNVPAVTERFVSVPWNGRDRNGDDVANGVYLYKIVTRDLTGSNRREVIGKLARLR